MACIVVTAKLVSHLTPPLGKRDVRGLLVGSAPINLWRNVINAFIFKPLHRVAEYAIVLPVARTGDLLYTVLLCHSRIRTTNASRRDTERAIGAMLLNGCINGFHHAVHIVASPVAEVHTCTRVLPLLIVASGVGGRNFVGIEVVVEHQSVNIVFGDDFYTHVHNSVDCPLLGRVKDTDPSIGE